MLTKTKIDWCDYTWNPVWGCRNNCPYCYARKMAKRFGDPEFLPTWKQKNFDKPFPKKPSRIFVNSMSDILYWSAEWMERVIGKISSYPEHTFLFLTKDNLAYSRYRFFANCWLGFTITNNITAYEQSWFKVELNGYHKFISIEPLHEKIGVSNLDYCEWVIIGAETGNRKGKVIPKREWIAEIVDYCKANNIPVFLKDSLQRIWGGELIQEFPA